MVPDERGDAGFSQQGADRRDASLEREISALAKIKNPLLGILWWRIGVDQGPAPVEDSDAQVLGEINRVEIRRAERRHEEHEL